MSDSSNDTNALLQEMMQMLRTNGVATENAIKMMNQINNTVSDMQTKLQEQNEKISNLETTHIAMKDQLDKQNTELADLKEQMHRRDITDQYRDGLRAIEDSKKPFEEIVKDTEIAMTKNIKEVSDDKSNNVSVKIALKDSKTGEFFTVDDAGSRKPINIEPNSLAAKALETGRYQTSEMNNVDMPIGNDVFEKKNHTKIEIMKRNGETIGLACISSDEPVGDDKRRVGDIGLKHLSQTLDIKYDNIEKAENLERMAKEREAYREKAEIDPLTKLNTINGIQSHLVDSVLPALKSGKDVSVIFADADGFKSINDNIGHAAGDAILKNIANGCRNSIDTSGNPLRQADNCFRIGGDEIGITIIGNEIEAMTVAERTHKNVLNSEITYDGDKDISLGNIKLCNGDTIKAGDIPVADKRNGEIDGKSTFGMSIGVSSFTEAEKTRFIEIGNKLETDNTGRYALNDNNTKRIEEMYQIWNNGPRARADEFASQAKKAGKNRIFASEKTMTAYEKAKIQNRVNNTTLRTTNYQAPVTETSGTDKDRTPVD